MPKDAISQTDQLMRQLNEAAYAALKAMWRADDPRAKLVALIAHETDKLVDGVE